MKLIFAGIPDSKLSMFFLGVSFADLSGSSIKSKVCCPFLSASVDHHKAGCPRRRKQGPSDS
jgi:hypothetical protein